MHINIIIVFARIMSINFRNPDAVIDVTFVKYCNLVDWRIAFKLTHKDR